MRAKRLTLLTVGVLAAVWVNGCSPNETKKQLPAVNDENCKRENLLKIEDMAAREQLVSRCLEREPKRSPKRDW